MLISSEQLRYSFQGAQFDLDSPTDRKFLGWILNQFLYGEVTGIQCGYWLYRAPSLQAASFLARQATEELSHVRKILRLMSLLGQKPEPVHPAIRFLTTGMMGASWGEHVALEMALGEGLVLHLFYALEETMHAPEIQKILSTAVKDEERHVEFGEKQTLEWLKKHPGSRKMILGQACLQYWVLSKLKKQVVKRAMRQLSPNHPIVSHIEGLYLHMIRQFERRVQLLGLSIQSVSQMNRFEQFMLIGLLPIRKIAQKIREKIKPRVPLLTSTYLDDPVVVLEGSGKRSEAHPELH